MNDTGGGVTAIHDVPGDITRIGFHWMLFFSFLSLEGGFYLFFTRRIAEITDFLCPEFSNFRIVSSHGMSRRSRIFFVPIFFTLSRIIELSNIFHTECRGGHGVSLSRIFELSNIFHTEGRGVSRLFYPETCPWTH